MYFFTRHTILQTVSMMLCTSLLFSACEESRMYDKNFSVGKSGWDYDDEKTFDIIISDTLSTYNLFINVRHTDQYPYNNIWLMVTTVFPDSTEEESRVNLEISGADGTWTGICSDGICFNSVIIRQNFSFQQTGKYTFRVRQDMRINPLPYLMNVGVKLEKFIPVN